MVVNLDISQGILRYLDIDPLLCAGHTDERASISISSDPLIIRMVDPVIQSSDPPTSLRGLLPILVDSRPSYRSLLISAPSLLSGRSVTSRK